MSDLNFDPQSGRFLWSSTTSGGGGESVVQTVDTKAADWARFEPRTLSEYAASVVGGLESSTQRESRALATDRASAARVPAARVVIVPRADPADPEDIASSFARWGEAGKVLLAEGLSGAKRSAAAQGVRLVLWPRVGTLISDIPGVLNLVRGHEDIGVLFDPLGMLAPDSARYAADFVKRSAEIVEHAGAAIDALYLPSELPAGVADTTVLEVAARAARVLVCRGPLMI